MIFFILLRTPPHTGKIAFLRQASFLPSTAPHSRASVFFMSWLLQATAPKALCFFSFLKKPNSFYLSLGQKSMAIKNTQSYYYIMAIIKQQFFFKGALRASLFAVVVIIGIMQNSRTSDPRPRARSSPAAQFRYASLLRRQAPLHVAVSLYLFNKHRSPLQVVSSIILVVTSISGSKLSVVVGSSKSVVNKIVQPM